MRRILFLIAAAAMLAVAVHGAAAAPRSSWLHLKVQPHKYVVGAKTYSVVVTLTYSGQLPSGRAVLAFNSTRLWKSGLTKPSKVTAPAGAHVLISAMHNAIIHISGFDASRKLVVTAVYPTAGPPKACWYAEAALDRNPDATQIDTHTQSICNYSAPG